jgi:hypothetical protein
MTDVCVCVCARLCVCVRAHACVCVFACARARACVFIPGTNQSLHENYKFTLSLSSHNRWVRKTHLNCVTPSRKSLQPDLSASAFYGGRGTDIDMRHKNLNVVQQWPATALGTAMNRSSVRCSFREKRSLFLMTDDGPFAKVWECHWQVGLQQLN